MTSRDRFIALNLPGNRFLNSPFLFGPPFFARIDTREARRSVAF